SLEKTGGQQQQQQQQQQQRRCLLCTPSASRGAPPQRVGPGIRWVPSPQTRSSSCGSSCNSSCSSSCTRRRTSRGVNQVLPCLTHILLLSLLGGPRGLQGLLCL